MTLDLTQFHDTFFAESAEALDQMEAALLKLSAGDADLELVNTIFRVAHPAILPHRATRPHDRHTVADARACGGKGARGEEVDRVAPDIAGGADDCDVEGHRTLQLGGLGQ